MNLKRFAALGLVLVILVAGALALTTVGSGGTTAYAKGIAQQSYQEVSSWTAQQQEAAKRAFGVDPLTLLQQALNANDLKVLTYDDLMSQSPNAVRSAAGDNADFRNLKFLQFTKDGAKVVVGIDQNNLPVFMGGSHNVRVIAH